VQREGKTEKGKVREEKDKEKERKKRTAGFAL